MRKIYRIARTELQTLFYSPIAWLILIVFTFQTCMVFVQEMEGYVRSQALGYGVYSVASRLYASWTGVFSNVQNYLYLYMPLLTMGLMSREFSSGSIKLLYSSPVTSSQIVMGKFLAMMAYGLVLLGTLILYIGYAACVVDNFAFAEALSGLLGLYLLLCAYAAIGLFVSCLTSYQVVAAIGGSPFGKGNAGQRCKRAVNVDLRKDGILLARFHESGPPHDERNTRSGFIQAVFAAAVDA